jgi:hypothetical protein
MPGGLGAVEAAILLAFTTFGFSPSQAVSLALFIRVRDLTEAAIGLLLGGVAWNKTQMPAPETATAAAEGLPPPVRSHAGAHAAKVDSEPPVLEKLDEDALPTTDFIAPEQRL